MKNWKESYKAKICTPDEAIHKIKDAKRISFGHICSESSVLTEALVRNKKLFKKLEIAHLLSVGKSEYAKEENSEYFRHNALFIGPKTREAAIVHMEIILQHSSLKLQNYLEKMEN